MTTVFVTGAGGFLGRAICAALPAQRCVALSHGSIDELSGQLSSADVVIHAGRDPRLGHDDYRLADDLELAVAAVCEASDAHFVHLGTRKVYAPSTSPLSESSAIGPIDIYGRQKADLEQDLTQRLGEKVTIARIANVFGFEPGRATFAGYMLDSLTLKGEIRFNMSPFVTRDFMQLADASRAIAELALLRQPGIVNVGTGIPMPCGKLALAVIEGFGSGRLIIDNPGHHDPFVLDVRRLHSILGWQADETSMLDEARRIGKRAAASVSEPA